MLCRAGLKGAAVRAKPDEASTVVKERQRLNETRSESREPSRLGLWRCSRSTRRRLFINDNPIVQNRSHHLFVVVVVHFDGVDRARARRELRVELLAVGHLDDEQVVFFLFASF